MKNRIDNLIAKIDALLEQQERVVALLENYLTPCTRFQIGFLETPTKAWS